MHFTEYVLQRIPDVPFIVHFNYKPKLDKFIPICTVCAYNENDIT